MLGGGGSGDVLWYVITDRVVMVVDRMMDRLTPGGRAPLDGDKVSAVYQAEAAVQGLYLYTIRDRPMRRIS